MKTVFDMCRVLKYTFTGWKGKADKTVFQSAACTAINSKPLYQIFH